MYLTRSSSGTLDTDKKFTGQRHDATGLYYYNARYYDPTLGRFISPDPLVPEPFDPQMWNRYSYCDSNPLKYIDPSGHEIECADPAMQAAYDNLKHTLDTQVDKKNDPGLWELRQSIDKLEKSDTVYELKWSNMDGSGFALTAAGEVWINTGLRDNMAEASEVLAHEL